MIPGKDSTLHLMVFFLLGLVLGYGLWGAGENVEDVKQKQIESRGEEVDSLRSRVAVLEVEVEKRRKENYKLRSDYSAIASKLKKKGRAERMDRSGRKETGSGFPVPVLTAANPALVGTAWLAGVYTDPGLKIVFVDSWPTMKKYFDTGHIPGSVYLDIGVLMRVIGNGASPPDRELLESLMGKLGISNSDHIVLYGTDGQEPFTLAAFWLMKYFKHERVSYLDGGLSKWKHEDRPLEKGYGSPVATEYRSGAPDESIRIKASDVLKALNNPGVVIVDTRGSGEYTGTVNKERNRRTGHIPGALDLGYATANLDPETGTLKSVEELGAFYNANGVTSDKTVIVYCQSGIRAANTYFVLKHVLGYPDVRNYVGSWGEWANRLDAGTYPVETAAKEESMIREGGEAVTEYVGVRKCKACHIRQYNSWKKTDMAGHHGLI